MKIAMIGTGYVGLVTGACFSEYGFEVHCVDQVEQKVADLRDGILPIYEPGLEDIVISNYRSGRLRFTTDLGEAVHDAAAVFIAVGTPEAADGDADMSFVHEAARQIAHNLNGYTVVVTKSTVPVGTSRQIARIIREENPDADFDVASNPEFLREGVAIRDFMRPDRVLLGARSERAMAILRRLYRPLHLIDTPIEEMAPETAELSKYAANSFLATKLSFINDVSDLCEKVDADVRSVAASMGHDPRIGQRFLAAGPGYGGSCFPKDTKAFAGIGRRNGVVQGVVEAAIEVNNRRRIDMANRIADILGGSVTGKTVGLLGLTFKPGTDDIRESPALVIAQELAGRGARVRAFDPMGMEPAAGQLEDVAFVGGSEDVARGADAVVLVTEWPEFRNLDLPRLKDVMRSPVFVDLRNVYDEDDVTAAGLAYHGIGRATGTPVAEPAPLKIAAE